MKRGAMIYVPKDFLDQLDQVKKDKGLKKNRDALAEVKDYVIVGRELERLMNIFGPRKKKGGFL